MYIRIALDTNRYSDFHRGDSITASILEQADAVILPFAVVAELRVGFAGGSRREENERIFDRFLNR